MIVTIEVTQLPPVEYSSNWTGHWAKKYAAGNTYRGAVYYEAVNIRNKLGLKCFSKPRLTLTFVFPVVRERDDDNLRSRFKPGQDALVQAGLLVDDSQRHLILGPIKPHVVDPTRAPLTIIELEETDEDEVSTRRRIGKNLRRENNPLLQ